MPSTTRGSILISTANDIGEALVEKLGGVGYSPNEWKEKYNLCGIAPIDSAPALSVLADSAGTGDERGSILIATADAIGAILNKKYNVLRGFKPKEWASACRKMKALEEGSVASASIASFSDGADTVPLTSCVCNIDANLDGKSAVVCTKMGKNWFFVEDSNLFPRDNNTIVENNATFTAWAKVRKNTTYYIKKSGNTNRQNVFGCASAPAVGVTTVLVSSTGIGDNTYYFNSGDYEYIGFYYSNEASEHMMMTLSQDDVSNYEPYTTPETKTADLGRAVYGGSADIIKGEGVNECEILTLAVADMNNSENYPGWRNCGVREIIGAEVSSSVTNGVSTVGQYWSYNTLGSNDILYLPRGQYNNMSQSDWINTYPDLVIQFVIQKATPENFTFEPVKIDSFPGVNNIWNDCGNTAVEYYKAPTPYTRKTATGGIANFSDQRTDLPLTKAIANIAPSIAGKSAVNLYQGSEQYQPTTTYTAELGETVYGGSVDFVSGEVKKTHGSLDMGSLSWTYHAASGSLSAYFDTYLPSDAKVGNNQVAFDGVSENYTSIPSSQIALSGHDDMVMALGNDTRRFFLCDQRYTNADDLKNALNGETLAYPLTTPTESAIPGRVISPIEGVNNYWNDAGGDTEIQYFENET